ncbi:hypothetical protein AWC36_01195 [Brenneria goodwinii]|uniref:hypothetical protein n=2 Tax=Brenneria goodwinii TaxID=1109412 RepID=UPI000BAF4843|nr:hypothetical protein [Brenneria goodwinii]ATA22837.1 hypothetical protein AWC36_01195 [Brenneria goodwinii]
MKLFNFFLIMFTSISFSVTANTITLYGGYYSCDLWNSSQEKQKKEENEIIKSAFEGFQIQWLAGYMTAFNQITGEDNFPVISTITARDFVSDYCIKNKSKDLFDGLLLLRKKLKNK